MKTPADIEKLKLEELERMADDTSVEVPETLERKVTDALIAVEVLGESTKRNSGESSHNSGEVERRHAGRKILMLIPAAAAAVVAAVAIGLNVYNANRTPVDTFSTPEEALACLEQTFSLIGSKTDKSLEVAEHAGPRLEKTYRLLNMVE